MMALQRAIRDGSLFRWLVIALSLAMTALYLGIGAQAGGSAPLLPVDDVYIHFQYARQLVNGEPFVYNPGLPPTSGATSLIYPFVLAAGYALGFQGLGLAVWAVGIGGAALAVSALTIERLLRDWGVSAAVRWLTACAFALSGTATWHYASGMETGLVVMLALLTLYAFSVARTGLFVAVATLLALARPEGSIMALIAAGLYALRILRTAVQGGVMSRALWRCAPLGLPVLAFGAQPVLNYLLTGSFSASGGQSKSLTGMIPAYPDVIIGRIAEQYARGWWELLVGVGEHGIWYLPPLAGVLAVGGLFLMWRRGGRGGVAVLVALWWGVILLAIATLDTAFWHFKRYHLPLLALVFPLLAVALDALPRQRMRVALAVAVVGFSLLNLAEFTRHYAVNVENVARQPLSMARWVAENAEPGALVAVHDVGILRYLGERTTLDMVGLTTPGAADYWRHGPGAVAEYLIRERPDLIAAYTTARGLNYLEQTDIYGETLATFTAEYDPRFNVALGAPVQVIARTDFSAAEVARLPVQSSLRPYLEGMALLATVNVAELASEVAHGYTWSDAERLPGFATEVYQFREPSCDCDLLDGGRRINGEEAFSVLAQPGVPAILITRLHPVNGGEYTVMVDDVPVGVRTIPPQPGRWLEVATYVPPEAITGEQARIRIVPRTPGGHYMPYHHWWYQGDYVPAPLPTAPLVTFADGALALVDARWQVTDQRLTVDLTWHSDGAPLPDGVRFVHLYDRIDAPPVAQDDARPADGTLSPANWLPGLVSETVVVEWSYVLPPGDITLMLGFYDPVSGARWTPDVLADGWRALPDGRVIFDVLRLGSE